MHAVATGSSLTVVCRTSWRDGVALGRSCSRVRSRFSGCGICAAVAGRPTGRARVRTVCRTLHAAGLSRACAG
eukprot:4283650-Prymnesium_polylepis.1